MIATATFQTLATFYETAGRGSHTGFSNHVRYKPHHQLEYYHTNAHCVNKPLLADILLRSFSIDHEESQQTTYPG